MNTDKFKSIALNIKTYNRLREMSDNSFDMPVSLARTNEYIINKAYEDWNKGKYRTIYKPFNIKFFKAGDEFTEDKQIYSKENNKKKSLIERIFKK